MRHADPFVASMQRWIEVFMRRSMRNFILYTKESGLSMSQAGALFFVHRQGTCGVTDLGEHLGVTSAAASQMLDRLVQQGLLARNEDPNDRRVKQIALTDAGERALRDSMHARQRWLVDLADAMSTSEKEQVMAALEILIERAAQEA